MYVFMLFFSCLQQQDAPVCDFRLERDNNLEERSSRSEG